MLVGGKPVGGMGVGGQAVLGPLPVGKATVTGLPSKALFWPLEEESVVVVALRNRSGARISVKARCSDNASFRLSSVNFFLNDQRDVNVSVVRKAGAAGAVPKAEKLLFHWIRVADELAMNPAMVWLPDKRPEGLVCIPLLASAGPPAPLHELLANVFLKEAPTTDDAQAPAAPV